VSRFAISDMHGCLKTFNALLKEIKFKKSDKLYILGDMIDRGPDSAGVVQRILDLKAEGYKVECLMGNHEHMMLQYARLPQFGFNRDAGDLWKQNGGDKCLDSYGMHDRDTRQNFWEHLPLNHRSFFETLPYYIKLKNYVLVHAGLNFGRNRMDRMAELMYGLPPITITDPIKQTSPDGMVWDRDFTVKPELMKGKILVTGHTPLPLFDSIWPMRDESNEKKHIMIDGGCWYTDHKDKGFGYLVALRLDDKELFWVENCE